MPIPVGHKLNEPVSQHFVYGNEDLAMDVTMIGRTQTALAFAFAIASIACGSENAVGPQSQPVPGPEKPNLPVASINSVRVILPTELAFVGSTMTMSAVIVADSGARYTVNWSLAAGTTTATIDAATGVLTALAPGNASPIACAVAALSNGQTKTVCGEATIRVERDYTVIADHELAFVRNGTVFVARLDGSEPVALVTGGTRPAWSPDRSHVAFTRPADNQATRWQVCIARSDGSGIRCATGGANGVVTGTPSWSPDAKMVAFTTFTFDCPNGRCGQYGGYFSSLLLLNTLWKSPGLMDTQIALHNMRSREVSDGKESRRALKEKAARVQQRVQA